MPKKLELDAEQISEMFLSGDSVNALAKHFAVCRETIVRRLKLSGIEPRTQTQANRLMMSRRTPEENRRNTAAAHTATLGRKAPHAERIKMALGRERTRSQTSPAENLLGWWLTDAHIPFVPQKAIDAYNTDFGLFPTAIEVWGGGWHTSGEHAQLYPRRTAKFFELGWDVLIIVVNPSNGIHLEYPIVDRIGEFTKGRTASQSEVGIVAGHGKWATKILEDPLVCPSLSLECLQD